MATVQPTMMVAMANLSFPNTNTQPHITPPGPATHTQQILPAYLNAAANDYNSMTGKFGWTKFDDIDIPYLSRAEEKYVSLRIVHEKKYISYTKYFNPELFSCLNLNFSKMTAVEARLLNDINFNHCDSYFGNSVFTTNDFLVTLNDAFNLLHFLQFCYQKLICKNGMRYKLCGFVRINSENCIPYVWLNNKQYVPLFYFDGECKYLEERSLQLQGWPLVYLKLCCKIHGIRKALFDKNSLTVVDLELVKNFFLPGTPFEESWPTDNKLNDLLTTKLGGNTGNRNNLEKEPSIPTTQTRVIPTVENPTQRCRKRDPPPYPTNPTSLPINPPPCPTVHQKQSNSFGSSVANPQKPLFDQKLTCKIIPIEEIHLGSGASPYFLLRSVLDGKYLHCVNLLPFDTTTMLVPMEEAMNKLYIPVDLFVSALNFLNFDVYIPNTRQRRVLAEGNIKQTRGLLKMEDLVGYINNIRNICFKLSFERKRQK